MGRRRKGRIQKNRVPKPSWKIAGYRSGLEYSAAKDMLARGVVFTYEPIKLQYTIHEERSYTPDFAIKGLPFYLEFKGWLTSSDRKKAIKVRESNPDIEVRFVFQNALNKIRKGSKTSYSDWCDKNGFKWADSGVVPQQWLDEKKDTI